MMQGIAESIKNSVSSRQALELYGIPVDRHGYACCPFHREKTASLRAFDGNKGWCCFGCHATGSVIDLVMRLFHINYGQAIVRINSDFGLNLPLTRKPTSREMAEARKEQEERRRKRQEELKRRKRIDAAWESALEEWLRIERIIAEQSPTTVKSEYTQAFADALWQLPMARYALDRAEYERREAYCRKG